MVQRLKFILILLFLFLCISIVYVFLDKSSIFLKKPLDHRIGIRAGGARSEFYTTATNEKFIPRGNNYIHLDWQIDPFSNTKIFYHATFDEGKYTATQVNSDLAKMHDDGYNIVRIFINDVGVGDKNDNSGLSNVYMNNVSDFIKKAATNQIYTLITFVAIPKYGGYYKANPDVSIAENINWFYLTSEGIDAKKRYIKDFITALKRRNAPLDFIFAYSLENEVSYLENVKPFTLDPHTPLMINGRTYHLAIPAEKQALMDDNLVYWLNEETKAVKSVDPDALVTSGFFSPAAVGGADPRVDRTYWALMDANNGGSIIDFVDLHIYPKGYEGQSFENDLNAFEIKKVNPQKPYILGEFGMAKVLFPEGITNAAQNAANLQKKSCQAGFSGWLYWTWDTSEQTDPAFYTARGDNEAINTVLAPRFHSNPCL